MKGEDVVILLRLLQGVSDRTVRGIEDATRIPRSSVHRALGRLERAGLVSRGRDAQRRPCRLAAAPLHEIADWVATYRRFWEQRFDRLEDYLRTAQQQPAPAPASTSARKKRTKPHGRKSK